ncbi:SDR family oxidoreductase [Cohnella herbarum]|uniref:SDR family oxidoreductase n=1 Tax=Cohnella herbarum TaxID=2728023 RepID=UPI0020C4F843|nr:SDR family oxidoreductase [Cohnella herbarum]
MACEAGPQGIRVICLRSSGSRDMPGVREAMRIHANNAGISIEELEANNAESTLLKKLPKLAEVADVAVLLASDRASTITGAIANVTCGGIVD